ncbi:Nif3-like dinuclear metal center hexameric protein [Rubrobacter taiwanensis]|jgi:dinuclear metal center YbgI/SA1388 family protein|uniref:GTP cyclohydrolase 1 type 2 homolog n=1 Tax=Rubrobacter taiwanensis TaxID=185139 RepID=A0A4R1BMZ5_9ACTN|nr:Nif3-like dinuclear metal center hexameric protein [Rubrobacter taiwanensis]TCJ18863.1 Nif3-like dinuclear metal center hexameric protein [Rubrobacter taiwanensis]
MVRGRDIAAAVEKIAPGGLAESWDNCGLQAGSLDAPVERVLVALTPLPEVFDEAEELGANFLLFHHPLIFGDPLRSVDFGRYPGDLILRAARAGLTVYAAHTSYDAAPGGVSVALARALGLEGPLEVVVPAGELRKLVVFVPEENAGELSDALSAAGAGVIGEYTHCTFRTPGTGTFRGSEHTSPHIGEAGRLEQVAEIRLETVVPAHLARRAAAAAAEAHPYEEMAYDLYPVDGHPEGCGYGRTGRLPEAMTPRRLAEYVSGRLGFPARLVSDPEPERQVGRVAVLGGSGGSFIRRVAASEAEAYVTGDIRYHEALLAESLGLPLIDAGHAATELPSLRPLAERLGGLVDVPVEVSRVRR